MDALKRKIAELGEAIRARKQRRADLARQKALAAAINRRTSTQYGLMAVEEARRAGVRVALACALIEQETRIGSRAPKWFNNVFGCDHGSTSSPPWCNQDVTRERVQALIRSGDLNGIGLSQLTSAEYVRQAEALGGAHVPRWQVRVGLDVLRGHIDALGKFKGIGAYNGGRGNPIAEYAESVVARERGWDSYFDSQVRSG